MSEIITVGLDLAKTVFQVHGADFAGRGDVSDPRRLNASFQADQFVVLCFARGPTAHASPLSHWFLP